MAIEDSILQRIDELLSEAVQLRQENEHGQVRSKEHAYECRGWITAASNLVQLIVQVADSPYRRTADKILDANYGHGINRGVGELSAVLTNLRHDAQAGLLSSVADYARAEVFDDFLDHAKFYLQEGHKNEAGVISGVVFEDSLRRVSRKRGIDERGRKLDELITDLAKLGTLSATKAKRARAAADVRTKATHAQWADFDNSDVAAAIEFASELIATHLED